MVVRRVAIIIIMLLLIASDVNLINRKLVVVNINTTLF